MENRIKEIRTEKGLTRIYVSKITNISYQRLVRIEKGAVMKGEEYTKLSILFNVPIEALI